ncbi:BTAD domain-containing putative transcriptional regulator [Streptomyces canus]|uniref:AfsR/SARP family transcriptional regulator n=1 Tax=Streptomyces canus TaxID=58343 RepID=UPI0033F85323
MGDACFSGEIQLLNGIRAMSGEREVSLGSPATRTVFAILALRAGTAVSLPEIVEALWGAEAPKRAAGSVYTYISALRKGLSLTPREVEACPVLRRTQAGYRLLVPSRSVDVFRFEQMAAQARRLLRADDTAGALAHCDLALSEWKGTALGGSVGPFAETERQRLDLLRLDVLELRGTALIETGSLADAISTLSPLAAAHPLRERLQELLMLALWRDGRQADALRVYRQTRSRLVEELGAEPGPALQLMHRRVLEGQSKPIAVVRRGTPFTRPAELPNVTPGFAGRNDELGRLEELAEAVHDDMLGTSAVVSAVVGPPGVGKTALLVHAAHRLAHHFPDGQVFLDLRGFHPTMAPVEPKEALRQLLHSLGAERNVDECDLSEMAAMYRSMLAGRRMLIVLDNALDSGQVRPLLPGAKGCLALVSSRDKLTGLVVREGAIRVPLEVLRPEESLDLLRRVLGDQRVDSELTAACDLAGYCGHLPLALQIAAVRLMDGEHSAVGDIADELRRERDRLDGLAASEDELSAVRSVFSWSYRSLDPAVAHAFRLLALHPGVDFSLPEATALIGADAATSRSYVQSLMHRHLLQKETGQRYRFHDLARLYAAECAVREESHSDRKAAIRRIVSWYLASVLAVRDVLTPGLGAVRSTTSDASTGPATYQPRNYQEGLTWASRHLPVLLVVLRSAQENGFDDLAIGLACGLSALCHSSSRWHEWVHVTEIGQRAAMRVGDTLSWGRLLNDAGVVHHFLHDTETAIACHEKAVEVLAGVGGNLTDKATAEENMAIAYSMLGRHQSSLPLIEQALLLARCLDNPLVEVSILDSYCVVLSALGRHSEAIAHGRRCVALSREVGSEHVWCHALTQVGVSCLNAGRIDEAMEHLTEAHQQWKRLDDRWGEIRAGHSLAQAQYRAGRHGEACGLLRTILSRLESSGQACFYAAEVSALGTLLQEISFAGGPPAMSVGDGQSQPLTVPKGEPDFLPRGPGLFRMGQLIRTSAGDGSHSDRHRP